MASGDLCCLRWRKTRLNVLSSWNNCTCDTILSNQNHGWRVNVPRRSLTITRATTCLNVVALFFGPSANFFCALQLSWPLWMGCICRADAFGYANFCMKIAFDSPIFTIFPKFFLLIYLYTWQKKETPCVRCLVWQILYGIWTILDALAAATSDILYPQSSRPHYCAIMAGCYDARAIRDFIEDNFSALHHFFSLPQLWVQEATGSSSWRRTSQTCTQALKSISTGWK